MDNVISIPKKLTQKGDLIVLPKAEYEKLLKQQKVSSDDVLRWTREAKMLLKAKKLPQLEI